MENMPRKGRTSVFDFKDNAEDIPYVPLNAERVEEYAENLSEQQLINFIMVESENYRQDRLKDVSVQSGVIGRVIQTAGAS